MTSYCKSRIRVYGCVIFRSMNNFFLYWTWELSTGVFAYHLCLLFLSLIAQFYFCDRLCVTSNAINCDFFMIICRLWETSRLLLPRCKHQISLPALRGLQTIKLKNKNLFKSAQLRPKCLLFLTSSCLYDFFSIIRQTESWFFEDVLSSAVHFWCISQYSRWGNTLVRYICLPFV